MGVNEMRIKNITVSVSARVSVTVRVSSVLFVSSNTVGGDTTRPPTHVHFPIRKRQSRHCT